MALEAERGGSLFLLVQGGWLRRRSTPALGVTGDAVNTDAQIFDALSKEALFTKELLGYGATLIREANYARRGAYFQAFSSLSIGLERIGKLCLLLDHFLSTNGCFPAEGEVRGSIGHNLAELYRRSRELVERRQVPFEFLSHLDGPIHQDILRVLSAFALGDRYSNIDLLVGSKRTSDPVGDWYRLVDQALYRGAVSDRKKVRISTQAKLVAELLGPYSAVFHTSEQGAEINDMEEASIRTGEFEAVAPIRQLYVLQIIRYWSEILCHLVYPCMSLRREAIPHMGEIFSPFRNPDSYIRTRKGWVNV